MTCFIHHHCTHRGTHRGTHHGQELRWGKGVDAGQAFTINRALSLESLVDVRLPRQGATAVSFSFEVKAKPLAQTLVRDLHVCWPSTVCCAPHPAIAARRG
jgi:hypothetical protein